MLLENPRYHLGSDGESSMVVFLGTRRSILAAVEETRSRLLVENPRYHLGSDGGSSRMDASTEATSGLACRGGMTAACSKNAKTAALQGVRRPQFGVGFSAGCEGLLEVSHVRAEANTIRLQHCFVLHFRSHSSILLRHLCLVPHPNIPRTVIVAATEILAMLPSFPFAP